MSEEIIIDPRVEISDADAEAEGYILAQQWTSEDEQRAKDQIKELLRKNNVVELAQMKEEEEQKADSGEVLVETSPVQDPSYEIKVKKNDKDFDWLSEQYKILIQKGIPPTTAFAQLQIPNIPATRRRLLLNMLQDVVETYTFSPEQIRATLNGYAMKTFLDAAVKGDQETALAWMKEIKRDKQLGYDSGSKVQINVALKDVKKFLNTEDEVINVEFLDKEE